MTNLGWIDEVILWNKFVAIVLQHTRVEDIWVRANFVSIKIIKFVSLERA